MVKISNDIFIGVNLNEVCSASPMKSSDGPRAWNVNYNGNLNWNNVDNTNNGVRPDFLQNRDLRNQGT